MILNIYNMTLTRQPNLLKSILFLNGKGVERIYFGFLLVAENLFLVPFGLRYRSIDCFTFCFI